MTVDIEELRNRLDWSLDEMARYFGVTGATVSRWQSGQTQPSAVNHVLLLKLWELTEKRQKEKKRRELGELLKGALLTGGVMGGLTLLFTMLFEDKEEDN